MSVQIKKNGVWEAVAGNATNTSGITESSALSNIGTSANATQHDVNVAMDGIIGDIGTIIIAEGNVHPTTAEADFIICQATIPAGTWIVNCFSDLNFSGKPGNTYNNTLQVTGAIYKTARTSTLNGGGSMVTSIISIDSPGVAYAIGYAAAELIGGADNKQRSIIEAIRVK
jgi:hypothetical protein